MEPKILYMVDNLGEVLLESPRSKVAIEKITENLISERDDGFSKVWDAITNGEGRVPEFAAWLLTAYDEKAPEYFVPYTTQMIQFLNKENHQAINRNISRVLRKLDIPEDQTTYLFDLAINWIVDPKMDLASRASMVTIARKIAKPFPELRDEVIEACKLIMPHASSGLKNSARKTVEALKKLQRKNK